MRPFFLFMVLRPPRSTLFPYTRSSDLNRGAVRIGGGTFPEVAFAMPSLPLLDKLGKEHLVLVVEATCPTIAQAHKGDRKSTRLNSSHSQISYAVFCLKKKKSVRAI